MQKSRGISPPVPPPLSIPLSMEETMYLFIVQPIMETLY